MFLTVLSYLYPYRTIKCFSLFDVMDVCFFFVVSSVAKEIDSCSYSASFYLPLFIFRVQPDMKCIIFVNRIVTARSLSYILQHLKVLSSWKCGFLVGVHSGLKSMSRKNADIILNKFRSGEVMLFY